MKAEDLKPNKILRGPIFSEPVQVILFTSMGDAVKVIGRGLLSGKVVDVVLTTTQLAMVESSPDVEPFNGDPQRFRLAVEAMRRQSHDRMLQAHVELIHRVFVPSARHSTQCVPQSGWFSFDPPWLVLTVR